MRANRRQAPHTNRRGITLVESALVLFLLLFVLIGIVDIGTVLFTYQGLVQRAQAGARYAVVNSFDPTAIKNVVVYGNPAGGSNPFFALNTLLVKVTSEDLDNQISRVQVIIDDYPVHLFTPSISGDIELPEIEATLTTESEGATT